MTKTDTNQSFGIKPNNFIGSIDNVSVREVGQDWVFTSGATLTDIGAKITHTPTAGSIAQSSVLTIGKQYKLTYEITESISGGLKFNSAIDTSMVTTVGVHTKYFEADGTTAVIGRTSSSNNDVTITNISVKEVGQNWNLGTDWGIGNNKAIRTGTSSSGLTQSDSFGNGKKYRLKFTISDFVSGSIKAEFSGGGGSDLFFTSNNIGNGTFTFETTTTTNRTALQFYAFSSFQGSITNISIIEITDDTNLPRINYEGFSYQDALGSELVTGANSGNINLSSVYTDIYTNASVENGKTYAVTFTAQGLESTIQSWSWTNYTPVDSSILYSNGTNTAYINATGNGNLNLRFYSPSGRTGSLSNISIKEYSGQEVVPDSGCGSWLWEPQSTNLIPYSSDYSGWSKNGASVLSGFVSPDGTTNASKITAASADPNLYKIVDVGLGKVTFSFYAKADEPYVGRILFWQIGTAVVSGAISHNFTLSNDWQRYEATIEVTTAGTLAFRLDFPINSGGNVGEYGYLWGAQVEQQSYATSYIPTSGSTVTRNKDLCTNGGGLVSINSTEGVLYAEIKLDLLTSNMYIQISDNSYSNRVAIINNNSSNSWRVFYRVNGISQIDATATGLNVFQTNKIAISWKLNEFKLFVNGTKITEDNSGIVNPLNTFNRIDFSDINNTNPFYGKTKCLAVWKEALSDQELTELTTI